MKFAAAATAVLAGVAQAAIANDAINQGQSANAVGAAGMDGMTLLTGLYGMENMKGYGGGGGGKGGIDFKELLNKAACALPCVEKALRKTKCQGNPLDSLCNSIDDVKEKANPCLKKCNVDSSFTGK